MNHSPTTPAQPTLSGKAIILTVAALALVGALFAWWYRHEQFDDSLAFWGPATAELLAEDRAQVEMLRIVPLAAAGPETLPALAAGVPSSESLPETLLLDGDFYIVEARAPGEQIRGLLHLRFALTQDASFDFHQPPAAAASTEPTPWPYLLRLEYEGQSVQLLLDPEHQRVGRPGGDSLSLRGPIAKNLGGYLEEVFAEESP